MRRRLAAPFLRLWDWWAGIPDEGQVSIVGLLLLGVGAALVWPPAGLVAPGVVMTAISLGFTARDRAVAIALVVVTGLAVTVAIAVGGVS